ncbi:hypothetical protein CCP3SC1AL1_1590011 [Gammaproteobacteria bacterium]
MDIKQLKSLPLTNAERQANRQMKLKQAYDDCQRLKNDVRICSHMIKNVLQSLEVIPVDSDHGVIVQMVKAQICHALTYLNNKTSLDE